MLRFNASFIEDELKPIVSGSVVSHYTKIGTLCHFVSEINIGWGSAWATPIQFLNDRKELLLGLEVLHEIANQHPRSGSIVRGIIDDLLNSPGRLGTDAFQMSFSGNPDELGQWRGYASNGMGCSVVTYTDAVKQVADIAGWIIYDSREQKKFARKLLKKLRNETDINKIEQIIVATASYMKHDGFAPEKEFRLLKFPEVNDVCFRETGNRLVPYVDFLKAKHPLPIIEIIIGPGWQLSGLPPDELSRNYVVQGIRRLVDARGSVNTDIKSSLIPYDPQ